MKFLIYEEDMQDIYHSDISKYKIPQDKLEMMKKDISNSTNFHNKAIRLTKWAGFLGIPVAMAVAISSVSSIDSENKRYIKQYAESAEFKRKLLEQIKEAKESLKKVVDVKEYEANLLKLKNLLLSLKPLDIKLYDMQFKEITTLFADLKKPNVVNYEEYTTIFKGLTTPIKSFFNMS